MDFADFRDVMQRHIETLLDGQNILFQADVDNNVMWNLYLDSFPPGTNEIYRERREFDCSCCRSFIKSFGGMVVISQFKTRSIWDFEPADPTYAAVTKALSEYVLSKPIRNIFVTKEGLFGQEHSIELKENGNTKKWYHFHYKLPKRFVTRSPKSIGDLQGKARDAKNVFQRSLTELTEDSIETILELIAQKSLYKGEEWKDLLTRFLSLHKAYHALKIEQQDAFCWTISAEAGPILSKIRNHSIGVLLQDISNDVELDDAVKRYTTIVAPSNYKRPKAIFTKKMVEQAQTKLEEMGLLDSLGRRHAKLEDITVNNILFANRDAAKQMGGTVFDTLKQEVSVKPKQFERIEEVPIETFVSELLPNITQMELLLENKHSPNLVSLIAPTVHDSPSLFKWDNSFSWAYNGNITDSMKERVKAAGGNVQGVLRFSIQWNEDNDNRNDFDAHCVEPDHNLIYYPKAKETQRSSGRLDVDIVSPGNQIAVENIIWTNKNKMLNGYYWLYVHVYFYRGGNSGFRAEIEFNGETYSYDYRGPVKTGDKITVAMLRYTNTGFHFKDSMDSTLSSKTEWALPTNQFYPVSTCMYSPNYWDGQNGIGHRHYFFMLEGCKRDDRPNGFFNEFLKEEFMEHKRVFEALGNKTRVEDSDTQLSGIGFSSTKRNSVICKASGNFDRTIRIMF